MPSHDNEQFNVNSPEVHKEILGRMVQNVLWDRKGRGLDPLHAYRFEAVGVFHDVTPPNISSDILDVLDDPCHSTRIQTIDGPLLFARADDRVEVIEPAKLLLNPDRRIRQAALRHLKTRVVSSEPWLTPRTAELLEKQSDNIDSDDRERWRAAGLDALTLVRQDLFGHIAGFRQSVLGHFREGQTQYLRLLMRPSRKTLAHLQPPLWSPREQQAEIEKWIAEFSALPNLDDSLTAYVNRCGYVPLCDKMGSAEVVRRWIAAHTEADIGWDDIWGWAQSQMSPLAKYHACVVALHVHSVRPAEPMRQFGDEVIRILNVRERNDNSPVETPVWQLYCELAAHYSHHIEALHPGQAGDRVACYAWWLTDKVGRLFVENENQARASLENIIRPETEVSFSRWTVARSPTTPSSMRYATLLNSSVWAMSFLSQLSRVSSTLPMFDSSSGVHQSIGPILRGYVIASPLSKCFDDEPPIFGFQENTQLLDLLNREDLVDDEDQSAIPEILRFYDGLADVNALQSRLEQFEESSIAEQHLLLLFLKEAVFCTAKYDDAISDWLANTSQVVALLQEIPDFLLGHLFEALAEYQQRQRPQLAIRLPHILAYAIENSDDSERIRILYGHTLLMSINIGIVSPIQRLLSSKWRAEFLDSIANWRDNLLDIARHSEPWIAARVRATSAAISRLVGPNRVESAAADYDVPSEPRHKSKQSKTKVAKKSPKKKASKKKASKKKASKKKASKKKAS